MKFSEFIGNKHIVGTIRRSIDNNRVSNAYLFAGPEGLGKRFLAAICAQALLCKHGGKEPCQDCESCMKIEKALAGEGFHPDFTILEPEGRFIKVEQMRKNLIASTQMQPHGGTRQIFLIDPAESMHPSAANAFLKTLEEAPGSSVFFLISVNHVSLLPTIKSRCQQFYFQQLSVDELAHELMRLKGRSKEEALLIASLTKGSVGQALDFDLDQHKAEREIALSFVKLALGKGNPEQIFSQSSLLAGEPDKFPSRLELAFTLLRDIMLLSSAGSTIKIVNNDLKSTMLDLARGCSPRKLAQLVSYLAEMRDPLFRNVRIDSVCEQVMITGRNMFLKAS